MRQRWQDFEVIDWIACGEQAVRAGLGEDFPEGALDQAVRMLH